MLQFQLCPGGGIGRHKGLKIPRRKLRAGSSPAPGTIKVSINKNVSKFSTMYFLKDSNLC